MKVSSSQVFDRSNVLKNLFSILVLDCSGPRHRRRHRRDRRWSYPRWRQREGCWILHKHRIWLQSESGKNFKPWSWRLICFLLPHSSRHRTRSSRKRFLTFQRTSSPDHTSTSARKAKPSRSPTPLELESDSTHDQLKMSSPQQSLILLNSTWRTHQKPRKFAPWSSEWSSSRQDHLLYKQFFLVDFNSMSIYCQYCNFWMLITTSRNCDTSNKHQWAVEHHFNSF